VLSLRQLKLLEAAIYNLHKIPPPAPTAPKRKLNVRPTVDGKWVVMQGPNKVESGPEGEWVTYKTKELAEQRMKELLEERIENSRGPVNVKRRDRR